MTETGLSVGSLALLPVPSLVSEMDLLLRLLALHALPSGLTEMASLARPKRPHVAALRRTGTLSATVPKSEAIASFAGTYPFCPESFSDDSEKYGFIYETILFVLYIPRDQRT